MTSDVLQLLTENAEYTALLQAYQRALSQMVRHDPDAGWVPRLVNVPGIDDARLAPMHGKLIAHGLLSFQLTGRTSGVVYRVSADGREALQRLATPPSHQAGDDLPTEAAA
jgi:hypothetical protein